MINYGSNCHASSTNTILWSPIKMSYRKIHRKNLSWTNYSWLKRWILIVFLVRDVLLPQPFSPILVFSLKLWDPSSSLFAWIDCWKLGAFEHIFAFEVDFPPSCLLRSVSSSHVVCSSTRRVWNFCLNEENWCFGRNWALALLVFSLDRASFGSFWVLIYPPLRLPEKTAPRLKFHPTPDSTAQIACSWVPTYPPLWPGGWSQWPTWFSSDAQTLPCLASVACL